VNLRPALLVPLLFCAACAADHRANPVASEELWPSEPVQTSVAEPVNFRERGPDDSYGLPGPNAMPISGLLALLPQENVRFGDPRTFVSRAGAVPCNTGDVQVLANDLPAVIEGVVTLHPRRYLKIPVCDQDEKHYGSFTIEDDTGGIVVLRDSRIAPFRPGDRVRLVVDALTMTYLQPSTRAILTASVERLEPSADTADRVVYFDRTTVPFGLGDITKVRRVEGYAVQAPDNKNFGSLIISDRFIAAPTGAEKNRICELNCLGQCDCGQAACEEAICPSYCEGADTEFDPAKLPICWQVGLDVELTRRGFAVDYGAHLSVTGPVVDNYDVQIWVQELGQVEVLDEN